MPQDFSTSMQQRAITDQKDKGLWSKIKTFFVGESSDNPKSKKDLVIVSSEVDPACFNICSDAQLKLDTPKKWINDLIAIDSQGNILQIKRIDELKDVPAHWDSMPPTSTCALFPIPAGTPEYNDVLTLFRATCKRSVTKIERIQNPGLWKSLQIKKEELEMRNGHQNNEKRLFHGTSEPTIPTVNERGFNRSYAGKNAASYSNGSYFAVDANYSADDTYSKPNQNGEKFMYLCRVLVGDFAIGQSGMITPPAKGSSNTEMFYSVVDNISKPSMFVIFNDIQAYPEYLITFK